MKWSGGYIVFIKLLSQLYIFIVFQNKKIKRKKKHGLSESVFRP